MGNSSISCKRQRIEPYCIIHCTDNTKLISPNSLDSWKTLQKAAEIRKHEDILSIEVADDQIPNGIFYHRKCRITFTHKHDLDRIERSQKKGKEEENSYQRRSSLRQGRRMHPQCTLIMAPAHFSKI